MMAAFLVMVTVSVLLSGCWDDMPLDTRTLVLAMGFYPGPKPGEVTVDFAFPTPTGLTSSNGSGSGGSGGKGPPSDTLSGTGYTLAQAFSAAQAKTNRDLYLGHTILLVFSTQLSAKTLKLLENALERIGTLDKTPFVAAASAPFDKVVAVKMTQEEFPALYFEELFSCALCTQFGLGVRLWQMAERLTTPGVDLVLPEITPTSQGPAVDHIAVYRGYQYVRSFGHTETAAFALATGKSRKTSLFFPQHWNAEFNFVNTSMHLAVTPKGNTVDATVSLKATETLESISTGTESTHQLAVLSQASSAAIGQRVLQFLDTTQKNEADVLGVGRQLSWTHPEAFKRFKNWHQEYPHVHFTVKTTVKINKMGDIK
ncbi:spore gernimation protein [Sulfobacillus sp. DSM 109850]|uniref:Spore gernimation protein n=2 Tax=Sulfobacillus harzensis TaxID=2729629 RepID=A0A7Y0L195_9FIRM|nr:spore gernimation protein [Sulfobacillus harzensis]